MTTINENICPICQQHNLCGVKGDTPCWCTQVTIPKALIETLPKTQQGKACICANCIEQYNFQLAQEIE